MRAYKTKLMKLRNHNILILILGLCAALPLLAQECEEATATDYLQANRLMTAIRNGGDLFTDGQSAQFLTPNKDDASTTRAAIYAAGLWMGGYDAGGDLHLAAQTYRQAGNDYWAGPIFSATGNTDSLTCERFDYVWQVDLLDVLQVIQDYQTDQVMNEPIPGAILIWPGNGNPYYFNQLGFVLPNQDLAPFYDRNSDGVYNPYDGDYPVFEDGNPNALADELSWTVFNDIGRTHEVSDTLPLGIEVQLTAYAFNCGADVLGDAVFTRHRIINRSANTYYNFRAGMHIDFDLGCESDDYIGTDSSLNTIYAYNADIDDNANGCAALGYGMQPPVVSATFLNQDLKKSMYNIASTLSPLGHPRDPQPAVDYYNLLSGKWVGGLPLTYGALGYDSLSTDTTDFVFPNYPSDTAANKWWAGDGFAWAQGQDFRMIGSIWGDTLLPGEVRDIDMVYTYHYDANLTGLYNMLQLIPQRIPQIQQLYDSGFNQPSCQSFTDFDADVQGQLYWDKNQNCIFDANDEPISNVVIEAKRLSDDHIVFATTDSLGQYSFIQLPFDEYELKAIVPSPYWIDACAIGGIHDVLLSHPNQIEQIDIALRDAVNCSFLEVDVSTPVLRHCADNLYSVTYCNHGTDTAYNAEVLVQLDSALILNSSTLPATAVGSNTYRFAVGDIAPNSCAAFDLYAFLDCDSSIVGQTHCVEASISPDSLCINFWNGPVYEIQANCMGDSIQYLISNIGTASASPIRISFIVIEDDLMRPPMDLDIFGTQTTVVSVPTNEGASLRAEVNQPVGMPTIITDPLASIVIEGCGADSLGAIHLGYVNQFSNGYSSPFKAIDCQENVDTSGAYQLRPSLFVKKQAFPKGYSSRNYIYNNTAIDYHIRVENVSLTNLVIRDTISPYLDISSFEAGASSHPYTWEIYDEGIVEFSFDSVKLNTPVLDDVYIKYRFKQKPFLPQGTIIQSSTEVELSLGQIIRTNDVFHEVQNNFVQMLSIDPVYYSNQPQLELSIQPHPVKDQARLILEGLDGSEQELRLEIYNPLGQLVHTEELGQAQSWIFHRGNLSAGLYFFKINNGKELLSSGQMSIQ
jgi:hypothetical protein